MTLPKVHKLVFIVNRAKTEIQAAIDELAHKHKLTSAEILYITSDYQSFYLQQLIRTERKTGVSSSKCQYCDDDRSIEIPNIPPYQSYLPSPGPDTITVDCRCKHRPWLRCNRLILDGRRNHCYVK